MKLLLLLLVACGSKPAAQAPAVDASAPEPDAEALRILREEVDPRRYVIGRG